MIDQNLSSHNIEDPRELERQRNAAIAEAERASVAADRNHVSVGSVAFCSCGRKLNHSGRCRGYKVTTKSRLNIDSIDFNKPPPPPPKLPPPPTDFEKEHIAIGVIGNHLKDLDFETQRRVLAWAADLCGMVLVLGRKTDA